jgi:hypothetical protein
MKEPQCNKRTDKVDRLVSDMTAAETVAWLVQYHDLPPAAIETVTRNLETQYNWHELSGRLHVGEVNERARLWRDMYMAEYAAAGGLDHAISFANAAVAAFDKNFKA